MKAVSNVMICLSELSESVVIDLALSLMRSRPNGRASDEEIAIVVNEYSNALLKTILFRLVLDGQVDIALRGNEVAWQKRTDFSQLNEDWILISEERIHPH